MSYKKNRMLFSIEKYNYNWKINILRLNRKFFTFNKKNQATKIKSWVVQQYSCSLGSFVMQQLNTMT